LHAASLKKTGNAPVICDGICPWVGVLCHIIYGVSSPSRRDRNTNFKASDE